ncbi:MAG TPA: hypothetical protein VIC07_08410 [Acidimicrobiia bacterium]
MPARHLRVHGRHLHRPRHRAPIRHPSLGERAVAWSLILALLTAGMRVATALAR